MLPSLRKFNANEVAQERLKIIEFYDAEGEEKTQKYFHVNRKTLNVCKKKLARSGHRLEALAAQSTRPKRVRRMTTDPRIVGFIRKLREEHPRLGKEKKSNPSWLSTVKLWAFLPWRSRRLGK